MKNKKKLVILLTCIALVVALAASIVTIGAADRKDESLTSVEETGDAQYRFTYVRVGGTDEEPIYSLVIEVIGDEPLVIEGGTILGGEMGGN